MTNQPQRCPHCGAATITGSRFCTRCGKTIEASQDNTGRHNGKVMDTARRNPPALSEVKALASKAQTALSSAQSVISTAQGIIGGKGAAILPPQWKVFVGTELPPARKLFGDALFTRAGETAKAKLREKSRKMLSSAQGTHKASSGHTKGRAAAEADHNGAVTHQRYCSSCRAEIYEGDFFCTKCGAPCS